MSNISANKLNKELVPIYLQKKSKAQICAFINSCSCPSNLFKNQVINFYKKMSLSKQYTAERKFYCPIKVEWAVNNPPLIIYQRELTSFYNFATTGSINDGFVFILRKVLENIKKNNICSQYIKDGK